MLAETKQWSIRTDAHTPRSSIRPAGSDTVENAQKELAMWFPEGLVDNNPVLRSQIYE